MSDIFDEYGGLNSQPMGYYVWRGEIAVRAPRYNRVMANLTVPWWYDLWITVTVYVKVKCLRFWDWLTWGF